MIKFPTWVPIKELTRLVNILHKYGETRLVGGCVREILARRASQDIDLATQVEPEKVIEILTNNSIKCIPTGLKHGTVTAILNGHVFEITTLRHDVETYGRHAKVMFTDQWVEDAARRDFTINAMYLDLAGNLYDYFDGKKDLKNRIIRFVGHPVSRIKEDYLRIIRYFRFYSYFGGNNIDKPSLHACKELVNGLDILSGERINKEMMKILSSKHAHASLILMNKIGLFPHIALGKLTTKFSKFKLSSIPIVNLAAVLINSGFSREAFLELAQRWKLSNYQKDTLYKLIGLHDSMIMQQSHKALIYRNGYELYELAILLHNVMHPDHKISKIKLWQPPKFPISGHDLHKLKIKGQALGQTLKMLENQWVESRFKLKKDELLKLIIMK